MMNDFGLLVIGNVARATALATLGILLVALFRRKGPAAGASVSLATLLSLVAVSALGLGPWPRWWTIETATAPASQPSDDPVAPPADRPEIAPGDEADTSTTSIDPAEFERKLAAIREAMADAGPAPPPPPFWASWGWPAWVGLAFLASVGFGLARLAFGVLGIVWLRKLSRPIEDVELNDLAAILRAEMSLRREVELREVSGAVTPATFGWRRPVLLLPTGWREWSEDELRAVLAHELAHVQRDDYVSGVLAQVSLSLHYYHPLAHWLVDRLRLQQELAADAWGARMLGGNRAYLTTLAAMALRRDDPSLGWPTRAFLPTRGTLLRRIDMLRNVKQPQLSESSRRSRLGIGLALSAAALLVAGLRGPLAPTADANPLQGQTQDLDLSLVPADAPMVLSVRPADLLAKPELKKLFDSFGEPNTPRNIGQDVNLPIGEVEQFLLIWPQPGANADGQPIGPAFAQPSLTLIRSVKPQRWVEIAGKAVVEPETVDIAGKAVIRSRAAKGGEALVPKTDAAGKPVLIRSKLPQNSEAPAYAVIDDRTLVGGRAADLERMLNQAPGAKHPWDEAYKAAGPGQFTLLVDTAWVGNLYGQMKAQSPPGQTNPVAAIEPIWSQSTALALSMAVGKKVDINAAASGKSEGSAEEIARTMEAALVLGRNAIKSTTPMPEPMRPLMAALEKALQVAKVTREGSLVRLRAQTEISAGDVANTLAPAMMASRNAARRSQSMNNMKQIGLALHNYADTHGSFPPAVLLGPDGKTPHSWRVAILPYLDQMPLYKEYKLDEPWDSPSNRKVLEKMPAFFNHPREGQAKIGTTSSYYVLTGPATLFPPDSKGTKFADVTDGLSNTIMVVEAQRDIPWTKPEDIAWTYTLKALFDRKAVLPKLGGFSDGGFNVLFGDGSVRFIKDTINKAVLQALITRAEGEVISMDALPR